MVVRIKDCACGCIQLEIRAIMRDLKHEKLQSTNGIITGKTKVEGLTLISTMNEVWFVEEMYYMPLPNEKGVIELTEKPEKPALMLGTIQYICDRELSKLDIVRK